MDLGMAGVQILCIFSLFLVVVCGQDVNWGKKVKCFTIQGTVVCPECNFRAGLTCPRRPKDKSEFDSCEPPSTLPPPITTTETIFGGTMSEADKEKDQQDKDMEMSFMNRTHLWLYLYRVWGQHPREPASVRYYIHRSFNRHHTKRSAMAKDISKEDDDEVCRWNGDCPCPLICCKRGKGCPMRCVMGVRLPPHIYG